MTVRFTRSARREFIAAIRYIARHDPNAAVRFRNRAESKLRRLERFPSSGRRLPEFPRLPHRELIVRPYRFFYRVRGPVVWVVAVWHGARMAKAPTRSVRRSS